LLAADTTVAQESPDAAARIWNGESRTPSELGDPLPPSVDLAQNGLPHVMITGYWPPTNEMLRQFSQDPDQNPDGWVGEDWEGRGYNIYAFFPEFPGGTGANPKGDGDFEVDYQDTSNDWWPLANEIHPIAIVTFSRANTSIGWELEGGNRTYSSEIPPTWSNDYLVPLKPTPELPSYEEPPGTERFSTLPIDAIIEAVEDSDANVDPFSTVIDNGRFLSNYIGYHGNWYHDLHADRADEFWSIAGGHIHVGLSTALPDAVLATEVTLRVLTEHLDARRALIEDQDGDGDVDVFDFERMVDCTGGPGITTPPAGCGEIQFTLADLDGDDDVDFHDIRVFQIAGGTQ
jgi:hypothetical protein